MRKLLRIGKIAAVVGTSLVRFAVKKMLFMKGATLAAELRRGCEKLGTTFIKFGQLIGMNPGIFPESFVEEFKKCLDHISPLPWATIQKRVQEELGNHVFDYLADIDQQPLSSASIAQVHRAALQDGTQVVIKVQRPHIAEIIQVDIEVLTLFFTMLLKLFPSLKPANPLGLIKKFDEKIHDELDFVQEGKNCERFAKIFENEAEVVVPGVFWDLTTAHVLTIEYIDGIKITEMDRLKERKVDFSRTARIGMKVLLRSAFGKGFFHADMHAANIIVMAGGELGFVDFGLMETMEKNLKKNVLTLLHAVYRSDFNGAAIMMKEISRPENDVDENFYEDVREVGEKYLCNSLAGKNWKEFITETLAKANKYRMRLPLALVLLIKQLLYLDGLGRMMDLNHDLLQNGAFFSEYFGLLLQGNEQ